MKNKDIKQLDTYFSVLSYSYGFGKQIDILSVLLDHAPLRDLMLRN